MVSRKSWKKGFWLSLGLLCLIGLRLLYAQKLPLQFSSYGVNDSFETILAILAPIMMALAVFCDYQLHRPKRMEPVQVLIALVLCFPVLLFSAMLVGFKENWKDDRLIYQGRVTDHQIIEQVLYDDSWPRTIKVKPLIAGLRWVTPADITQLEESRWVEVSEREGHIPR